MMKKFRVAQKVFVFNKVGKLLILKFSDALLTEDQRGKWDFPGGGVEWGESLEEGLERELGEELGESFKAEKGQLVAVWDWYHGYSEGYAVEEPTKRTVCVGYEAKYVGGEVELSDEHDDFAWVKVEELDEYGWFESDYKAVTVLKEKYGEK